MRWTDMLKHVVTPQMKFMEQSQALLHGDLHTGSILVTPESTQACLIIVPSVRDSICGLHTCSPPVLAQSRLSISRLRPC